METFVPGRDTLHGPIMPQFIFDMKITSGAKIMYTVLCGYASHFKSDHCYPSHSTLAKWLSCSVSSVKKYLGELVGAKLIYIQDRYEGSSKYYYMLRPAALDKTEAENHKPDTAQGQPKVDYPQPKSDYLINLNNQEKENTPPLPPVTVPRSVPPASRPMGGGDFSLQDFEKAWEAYPKKESIGYARAAWKNLLQDGQLPPLADILAAIKRFSSTERWQREHGRFIPQMSRWLIGECWLDPLSSAEEEAARLKEEKERAELASKREQEAREAENKAKRERLLPIYEAFKAKFPEERRNDTFESMLQARWFFLQGKYGGPTAADVPEANTQNIYDFMKCFQPQREAAADHATRPAQAGEIGRERKPVSCGDLLRNSDFMSRMFPGANPLCAAV